jgi:type IV pilus assembly protein PilV
MIISDLTNKAPKPSAGFSIIEVMVAMILLAGGLMGVAYMQNYSLRYGQESYHRSQIMVNASEVIDSMRSFQISPDDGTTDYTTYTATPSSTEMAAGCNPTLSTPRNDTICFFQQIANNLPFGTAQIGVQAVDADTSLFTVSVFWADRGLTEQADLSDAEQSGSQINLSSQSDCAAAENRAWSGTLSFPLDNGPSSPQCLVAHTWSVQILNTDSL